MSYHRFFHTISKSIDGTNRIKQDITQYRTANKCKDALNPSPIHILKFLHTHSTHHFILISHKRSFFHG